MGIVLLRRDSKETVWGNEGVGGQVGGDRWREVVCRKTGQGIGGQGNKGTVRGTMGAGVGGAQDIIFKHRLGDAHWTVEMPDKQLDMILEFRVQEQDLLYKHITNFNTCNRILPLSFPNVDIMFLVH